MAAPSVWAAREDGEVWVHLGGVERINVTRLQTDVERLREALEEIAGHFIAGERNTYAPAAETLDMIRAEAEEALAPAGCPCLGTPEQDDCPHA
jgi:hypothetical protein